VLINFTIGLELTKERFIKKRKMLLVSGILINLSLLAYYKYTGFFLETLNDAFEGQLEIPNIILPLAISFFTFQQIAYLVDSYKGLTKEYDFLNYAVFVTFFPQLIAGPIVHHKEMMPQFSKLKNKIPQYGNIAKGLFIFSIGLFKKVVIADGLALSVAYGFDQSIDLSFSEAWWTSLSYTLQLYFDFSGYSDMAIGLALLFNIKLPANFCSPYKARNIRDFWHSWHITLSRFLRDYVYIPLGGNKHKNISTYRNLFLTFLIGGVWHGAGWTFIFWGALHGLAIVIHRVYRKMGFYMPALVAWFLTFNFVNISWVFFRANEWEDAIKILSAMFNFSMAKFSFDYVPQLLALNYSDLLLLLGIIIVLFLPNSIALRTNFKADIKRILYVVILMVWSLISLNLVESEFLYFNF